MELNELIAALNEFDVRAFPSKKEGSNKVVTSIKQGEDRFFLDRHKQGEEYKWILGAKMQKQTK